MYIALTNNGKLKIGMKYQLQEGIEGFGEKIKDIITGLDSGCLYTVNYYVGKFDAKKKEVFHYVTEKLLSIKQARPDL